ncbi:hypothetical protein AAE478_008758 [Parahypoxylon ruwenzoriense]
MLVPRGHLIYAVLGAARADEYQHNIRPVWIHALEDPTEWKAILPRLQFELNNTVHATTGSSPNELALGFTPTDVTTAMIDQTTANDEARRALLPAARIDAADAVAIASMSMKKYYDARHTPKFFRVGDRVYLRLHKGYTLPAISLLTTSQRENYT